MNTRPPELTASVRTSPEVPDGPAPFRALLVQVDLPGAESQEDLSELRGLTETAGGLVVSTVSCRRQAPDPSTYAGSGKVLEIKSAVAGLEVEEVIFNAALTPAQERNLSRALEVPVIDRVALILRIFAQRARTHEGKLQVELARLNYEQARLVRGWTHLERQKGGFGLRGGPGETQIELDRRLIRNRISAINEALGDVARRRGENRRARERRALKLVSCVGYTNAGKSTLFNALTGAGVYAANQLFATLDPTLRAMSLKGAGKVVFADTVGFIRHLPHELVAAFRATLEETCRADLLLHVVDASDPRAEDNIRAVEDVLAEIGAVGIPTLIVANKADLLDTPSYGVTRGEEGQPVRCTVSARTGAALDELLGAVGELLGNDELEITVQLTPAEGRLRSLLHREQAVEGERYLDDGCCELRLRLRQDVAAQLDKDHGAALKAAFLRANPGAEVPWSVRIATPNADFEVLELRDLV